MDYTASKLYTNVYESKLISEKTFKCSASSFCELKKRINIMT